MSYFLAGPINGGGNWRHDAISLFHRLAAQAPSGEKSKQLPLYNIVSPDRNVTTTSTNIIVPDPEASQLLFERQWLEHSACTGGIIFWLPRESVSSPRKDGQYGRDTRFELGKWTTRYFQSTNDINKGSVKIYIGIEEKFPGGNTIRKNITYDSEEANKPIMIYSNLETMIRQIVSDNESK